MTVRSILLDTDIGSDVDDALALALILSRAGSAALDLVAVTTVMGDTATRARIASRLLAAGGRADVAVCAGAREPLARPRPAPADPGDMARAIFDGPDAILSDEPGPERIVRAAREVDGLEIVAIGPMTNVALALALDPRLPQRVAGLTVMGGHIRRVAIGDHVCEPGIDYNLCTDPEASAWVLGAGFRTTLVTADVTLQTWMLAEEVEQLAASGPVGAQVAKQVRAWTPVQQRIFTGLGGTLDDDNVAYLHDPLTILSLFEPEPLHFETLRIATTIERGVLRTHEIPSDAKMGLEMQVATEVDGPAASRAIMRHVSAGAP